MIDANLPIKLLAKSINTMIHIKNGSPISVIHKETITFIQDFYYSKLSNINNIFIFGFKTDIFNESDFHLILRSKT